MYHNYQNECFYKIKEHARKGFDQGKMDKYVIYGAGDYGKRVIEYIGTDQIAFYIDNNVQKQKDGFNGFEVYSMNDAILKLNGRPIIIALSEEKIRDARISIEKNEIYNIFTYREIQNKKTRERLISRRNCIDIYKQAIVWIKKNSINGEGIINNSELRKSYPEVTGYYIPSLIRWGYRDLAISYAKWLCDIQKSDGSWFDTDNIAPYVFDSAQILKGLVSVQNIYPDKEQVKSCIIKGCKWILSNMSDEGRLVAPNESIWGDNSTMSELIHLYCLAPLIHASKIYNIPEFEVKANKIARYYIDNYREEILEFNLLSHFYAYVMEALVDLGEYELATEAMEKIADLQSETGAVGAYKNVNWVCTTGLFQLAIVWFRLGNEERGTKAFNYACGLQNESGGWYGSCVVDDKNMEKNTYFPNAEISWAVKYFLDALYYKNLLQFENQAPIFGNFIASFDGRYVAVKEAIKAKGEGLNVLDIGCGKGRYLRNLVKDLPKNTYYAVDLSTKVMSFFEDLHIECKQGNITNIPYTNESFDIVYTCEALEHAIDINSAVREMARVTKTGGEIIIVDKSVEKLGFFDIEEWEQWFDVESLRDLMLQYCSNVEITPDISFDGQIEKGLFVCWKGRKK